VSIFIIDQRQKCFFIQNLTYYPSHVKSKLDDSVADIGTRNISNYGKLL